MRHLERMVRLAVEDDPAVVLLQELPAAALRRLEAWTGYAAFGVVAMRPRLPRELAMRITDVYPGLIRSAVEGQANAMLVAPHVRAADHRALVLNPRQVRARVAAELGLPFLTRLAWAKERRAAQALRVARADGRTLVVANLHATAHSDKRLAGAEVMRAATFATDLAREGEPVVLGGDFNLRASAPELTKLAEASWGFSAPGAGIDFVLARGAATTAGPTRWPDARRRQGDVLLSDHAPVEVTLE